MVKLDDALELLLPQAEPALVRRARDTIQFLRLLAADARGEPASRVGVDFDSARGLLEEGERRQLRAVLVDLLRHHLAHAVGPDSFVGFGTPRQDVQSAWSTLTEARAELAWLPTVPEPGESSIAVAARLLAALGRFEEERWEWELWQARMLRVQLGPRLGEEAFREGWERCFTSEAPVSHALAAWLAGWCECLLDRGAAREARALLLERRERVLADARLCQLLGWCKLLTGDAPGARALLAGPRMSEAPLPGPLHALRNSHPEWLALLPQRFVEGACESSERADAAALERGALGASACLAFAHAASPRAVLRHADVAPALRAGLADWVEGHLDALQEPGSCEQRLVLTNRPIVERRFAAAPLARVLGGEQTLAIALVPICNPRGEAQGWIHLEFEHHLVPREKRLCEWARAAWAHAAERAVVTEVAPSPPGARVGAEVFEALIERAGLRSAHRRWWGFTIRAGVPALVAEGAEAASPSSETLGGQALLGRVVRASGHVCQDDAEPEVFLHASSLSGLALALRWTNRLAGILVLESSRRQDFRGTDLERLAPLLRTAALELRVREFRAAHAEQHSWAPWFDAEGEDFQAFATRLLQAAASECSVLLVGPPGVGKTILARWLHHESAHGEEALHTLRRTALGSESEWRACLERSRAGSLLVEGVDQLAPEAQERLLEWLESHGATEGGSTKPRLIATAVERMDVCARTGKLRSDLAQHLDRVQFEIPPLRSRRQEIVPLVSCLCARFARQERVRVPTFEDEALALLWRQTWDGNVRELEGMVYRLVLFHPGAAIRAADVQDTTARFGKSLVRRLPSRHPARSDVLAALRSTLLGTGRVNKTRAAVYLGWDPDTLVARMGDLGVDPGELPCTPTWDGSPAKAGPCAETLVPEEGASAEAE